jgi:hypothetical protein
LAAGCRDPSGTATYRAAAEVVRCGGFASRGSAFVVRAAACWVREGVVGFDDEAQALDIDGSGRRGVWMKCTRESAVRGIDLRGRGLGVDVELCVPVDQRFVLVVRHGDATSANGRGATAGSGRWEEPAAGGLR